MLCVCAHMCEHPCQYNDAVIYFFCLFPNMLDIICWCGGKDQPLLCRFRECYYPTSTYMENNKTSGLLVKNPVYGVCCIKHNNQTESSHQFGNIGLSTLWAIERKQQQQQKREMRRIKIHLFWLFAGFRFDHFAAGLVVCRVCVFMCPTKL